MSFLDYFTKGNSVDFEITTSGKTKKYSSKVDKISDASIDIMIVDCDLNSEELSPGTKGVVIGKKHEFQFNFDVEIISIKGSSIIELKRLPSRSFLRVNAYIILEYKKISDKKILEKRKKYIRSISADSENQIYNTDRQLADDVEPISKVPSEMMAEIHNINIKLDYIIKLLGKSEDENIFKKEPSDVNISGAGIKFKCGDNFKPGDYVDIKLILPLSSQIIIELIGEVVRLSKLSTETDGDINEISIRFAVINEDDREFIIRYVFRRQRELLRA